MIYAQFYDKKLDGKIDHALGDRAVVVLDGRCSVASNRWVAYTECRKRGYLGYSLHAGDSFTRSKQLTPYCEATK